MKRLLRLVSWLGFLLGLFYLIILVVDNQSKESMILPVIILLISLGGFYSTRGMPRSSQPRESMWEHQNQEMYNDPKYDDSDDEDDGFDDGFDDD